MMSSAGHSSSASDYWVINNLSYATKPDLSLDEGEAARLALGAVGKLKGTDAHRLCLMPDLRSFQQMQPLFKSLDKHLFRGVLTEAVSFRFTSKLPRNVHGSTSALGALGNQILISLNSDLLRSRSRLTSVAALLHQMCHAYLLVCCGFGDGYQRGENTQQKHNLKHGLAFSSILHTLQDLLVDDARLPLPDLFHCSSKRSRSTPAPRQNRGRSSLHSYCHVNTNDFADKAACGLYMRQIINAAREKESQKVTQSGAEGCASFAEHPELESRTRRELAFLQSTLSPCPIPHNIVLPTSGDYQAMANLQTFLVHGDYDPRVSAKIFADAIAARRDSKSSTIQLRGPPHIQLEDSATGTVKESSGANPLEDLRTYILASRSNIEPLRRLCLARMYSQCLLKKDIDPITFLEEIYSGGKCGSAESSTGGNTSNSSNNKNSPKSYAPDADIRHFVRSFLCARHPDIPIYRPGKIILEYEETIFGRRVVRETTEPPATVDNSDTGGNRNGKKDNKDRIRNTNLAIIQGKKEWCDRLNKLRLQGGLFLEDLDAVEEALREAGHDDSGSEGIKAPDLKNILGLKDGENDGDASDEHSQGHPGDQRSERLLYPGICPHGHHRSGYNTTPYLSHQHPHHQHFQSRFQDPFQHSLPAVPDYHRPFYRSTRIPAPAAAAAVAAARNSLHTGRPLYSGRARSRFDHVLDDLVRDVGERMRW